MTYLKHLLSLCALAMLTVVASAQAPTLFGEFTSAEKQLKSVPFDQDADAVILHDIANAGYNDEYNLILTRRIRMKILKEKGLSYADIQIPYLSKDNFESIMNISAVVFTRDADGNETTKQIKNSDIFRQKLNDRVSVVKFALPNVKVGSIIEYTYESHCKTFGGLESWYFQSEIPTVYSSFFLNVLPRAEFAYSVTKSEDLPISIVNAKGTGTAAFSMRDIAGLRDEPYMDAPKDYLQHVDFQFSGYVNSAGSKISYLTKWEDVPKELLADNQFGRQLQKELSQSEPIVARFNQTTDPVKRLAVIHNYMIQNFKWNGRNSKYAEEDIKNAWEKRTGSTGDLNLVMINLLKASGLQAFPLLVSERSHGLITTTYPILDQFNKTLAYVVINGNTYVVDATDDQTPIDFIPSNVLNTKAFVVEAKNGRLIDLKDDKKIMRNSIMLVSTVTPEGVIDGEGVIESKEYGRIRRADDYRKDKEKFKTSYFTAKYPEIKIDSITVENAEFDSLPMRQHFKFATTVSSSGDYRLISTNLFTGFEKNPFIHDNRFTNINFGNKQEITFTNQIIVPATLKPEDLPKNIKLVMPDKSIMLTRTVSYSDDMVLINLILKVDKPVFTPDEYPLVKEFYKTMYSYLDEQLVLTSKK